MTQMHVQFISSLEGAKKKNKTSQNSSSICLSTSPSRVLRDLFLQGAMLKCLTQIVGFLLKDLQK